MRWTLLSCVIVLSGCEGVITPYQLPGEEPGSGGSGGHQTTGGGTGGSGYVAPDVTCDPNIPATVRLEDAIARFDTEVYPAFIAGESSCTACHAPVAGRRFSVTPDATETFHQARSAGFFRDEPGACSLV